ncbi:MAG: prepilin peptidase [Alphaproteobacteria bacterium]|nr:prepilin peptidase [Alphaproteobacteria bacterium]
MTILPPPFDNPWFRFAIGGILGATVGSFVTMLVHRVPRRMSIVWPRSHCPSCGATLGVRDLVPILSWLSSGGKCRHCRAFIGVRYLAIELACALAFGIAAMRFF